MFNADELYHRCSTLRSDDRLSEALELLEQHLPKCEKVADIHALRGQLLQQSGQTEKAVAALKKALSIDPSMLDASFTLGVALSSSGEHQQAVACFDTVLKAVPRHSASHFQLGKTLLALGRIDEACTAFLNSINSEPKNIDALDALSLLLLKNGHFDTAKELILKALSINPELSHIRNNLARIYQLEGVADKAIAVFREVFAQEPTNRLALSNVLYSLCYLENIEPEDSFNEHVVLCSSFFDHNTTIVKKSATTNPPFRIGYISGDFCLHSVSFFIEPVLMHHDRSRFEIFCYSNCAMPDETTARIRRLDLHWRDISKLSTEEGCELIKGDHLDLLIDLSGHSAGNRMDICALKPTPVMATWIGYPHSTGMQQFDYYISDGMCAPPGLTDHLFTEKLYRLPQLFSCYIPPMEFPAVSPPPSQSRGYITFASFNNVAKMNRTTIRLWSAVLNSVCDSKLMLKSASFGGNSARMQILDEFKNHGISSDRIIMLSHAPTAFEHLKLYSEVDITLDTFPYNGTTTTCEALWMGVPVITLSGRTHHSRVGLSILASVGISELAADSAESFITIAVELANNREQLSCYRSELRSKMAISPLMDAVGLTKELELAFTEMITNSYEKD